MIAHVSADRGHMLQAPIAVYTSGKGSSAAGLTASVIKDASGEFFLEVLPFFASMRSPGRLAAVVQRWCFSALGL